MIKYLDYYVPEFRLPLEAIFREAEEKRNLHPAFGTAAEATIFFFNTLNLREVAYAGRQTVMDMLDTLLQRFQQQGIVSNADVDLVIIIADDLSRSYRMPNMGQYILYTYGFVNADLLVISGNHCANIEYAISTAEDLLRSGGTRNILIVNANKYDRNNERSVGTYAVHGDGAGLVFMNNEGSGGIFVAGRFSYNNGLLYEADMTQNNSLLLCKNYLSCLSGFIRKYSISRAQIEKVLIPNANHALIGQCLNSLGYKREQLYLDNQDKFGHLDCVDFIVNLKSFWIDHQRSGFSFFSFGTGWAGSNICLYLQTV